MKNPQPRLILFDLGDTLVHIPPDRLEIVAGGIMLARNPLISSRRELVKTVAELESAISDEWRNRIGENINKINTEKAETEYWREFYARVLKRMGLRDPSAGMINNLATMQANPKSFLCFPDVHDTLCQLRAAGFVMGIISNAFPSASKILDELNLSGYFKYAWLSCDPPPNLNGLYAKPNPSIYVWAMTCARASASEVLFIDDRPKFVLGANQLGIHGILIDRNNQHLDWKGERIRNLTEIIRNLSKTLISENSSSDLLSANANARFSLMSTPYSFVASIPEYMGAL